MGKTKDDGFVDGYTDAKSGESRDSGGGVVGAAVDFAANSLYSMIGGSKSEYEKGYDEGYSKGKK